MLSVSSMLAMLCCNVTGIVRWRLATISMAISYYAPAEALSMPQVQQENMRMHQQ